MMPAGMDRVDSGNRYRLNRVTSTRAVEPARFAAARCLYPGAGTERFGDHWHHHTHQRYKPVLGSEFLGRGPDDHVGQAEPEADADSEGACLAAGG